MGADHHQHAALQRKTAPRTVIGSVSASEFLVAASASLGFLVGLRDEFFDNLGVVLALAVGGVIAAPIAAWLVSRISPALLGTAVGGVIVLTNSQKLVHYFAIAWPWSTFIYSVIAVAWAVFLVLAWRIMRAPAYVPRELEAEVTVVERPAEPADEVR